MRDFFKNNPEINFKDEDSLRAVRQVIEEATIAIQDKYRTMVSSDIRDTLLNVLVMAAGGPIGFAALYYGRSKGTMGEDAVSSVIRGGMPVVFGPLGGAIALYSKEKRLRETKELCYKELIKKETAIIKALQEEVHADKERIEYLTALNQLLQSAIKDLKHDLEVS